MGLILLLKSLASMLLRSQAVKEIEDRFTPRYVTSCCYPLEYSKSATVCPRSHSRYVKIPGKRTEQGDD